MDLFSLKDDKFELKLSVNVKPSLRDKMPLIWSKSAHVSLQGQGLMRFLKTIISGIQT